jgi:hypothetical protein
VTGCSAGETASTHEELTTAGKTKTAALGVDTNGATLDIGFAQSQGIGFVGRYVSFDGTHPALTATEAQGFHDAKMPLVLIWEIDQQRAFQEHSISGQQGLGAQDGAAAQAALQQVGAYGQVVYFTVDFDVTDALWSTTLNDSKTGNAITIGDLIGAYFKGVTSVIGAPRTGAYATYTVLHGLFDLGYIAFGWQQTFNKHANDPREKRAQLRQYEFGYDTTGWNVSGAGALDYDRAVHAKFGQWITWQ